MAPLIQPSDLPAIGIGPVSDSEGGVRSHIQGLVSYSVYRLVPIRYSPLSPFWPRYHGVGYTVFSSRIRSLPDPYAGFLARFRLRSLALIHTHGHPYWLSLYRAFDRLRRPRVHTVHQIYQQDETRSAREWVMRENQNRAMIAVCRSARAVIAVSESLADTLQRQHGIEASVIPNGVDTRACEAAVPSRFTRARDIGPEFVLYVGSFLGVKRPELVYSIARAIPSFTFVLVGQGLDPDTLGHALGPVPDNVLPLGPMPHGDVLDAMAASSCVLLTSRREASSGSALEGFGCGKPVVAPRGSGIDEVIAPVSDRLLFDPTDVATATDAIEMARHDTALGRRGRDHVRNLYDWRKIAPRVDAIYARVLAET